MSTRSDLGQPITAETVPQRAELSSSQAAQAHAEDVVQGLPASENKRFYPALDGLRAVAVVMVFIQHYFATQQSAAFHWGWTGVNIFFVLSGFLITGILYDTRNTPHRFRNFYVRRTLRIFPLYYGVLLLALLLTPFYHWIWHPAWFMYPLYVGNYSRYIWLGDWLQNGPIVDHLLSGLKDAVPPRLYFGHFWSLCVEEQFYLAWPLVVFLVKDRKKLRSICVAAFFGCLLARLICQFTLSPEMISAGFLERFTPLRVDSLLLGGFLALTLRGPEAPKIQRFAKPVLLTAPILFVAMQIFYLVTTRRPFVFQPQWWLQTVGFSVLDLSAAALILFAIQPETLAFRLLNNRWLRRLGQISYGFYVFHDIPHGLYVDVGMRAFRGTFSHLGLVIAVIAFLGTLVLSYLSFRFYEAPFLRLKDRFTV